MHCLPPRSLRLPLRSAVGRAFTLVEILVVLGIIVILLGLIVPAITSRLSGGDITRSAYDIAGLLDQARAFAMGNNTYVWVGFFEEDGSQSSTTPATSGVGRVIISVVASRDGTRYNSTTAVAPTAFGTGTPTGAAVPTGGTNRVSLTQINKLVKLSNAHLAGVNDGQIGNASVNNPKRPPVPPASNPALYQVGDAPGAGSLPNNATGAFAQTTQSPGGNVTTFTYPIPPSATQVAASPQYTFAKIIEFSPQGEASKITENTMAGAGLQNWMEVAIQPTHGNVIDPAYTGSRQTAAAAAIMVEGLSGRIQMFRP